MNDIFITVYKWQNPTQKRRKIIQQMTKSGLTQIKFKFTNEGAKVSNLYDYSSMK